MNCQTCGQVFDTKRKLLVHRARAHGQAETQLQGAVDGDPKYLIQIAEKSAYNVLDGIYQGKPSEKRNRVLRTDDREDPVPDYVDVDKELSLIDQIKNEVLSVQSRKRQREELRDKTNQLSDENQALKAELQSLEERRRSVEQEIEDYRHKKESFEDELESLEEEIQGLQDEERRLDESLTEYHEKKHKLTEKLESLNETLSQESPNTNG